MDLGAGDAKNALRLARLRPETLVLAVDATADAMIEQSVRSTKKPERGGVRNIIFLVADINTLPRALNGRVNNLLITLPWASLLRRLVVGDASTLQSLRRILTPDGSLTIVLNLDPLHQRVPRKLEDLATTDLKSMEDRMRSRYAEQGLQITCMERVLGKEKREIGSAWAKKLAQNSKIEFLRIEARPQLPSSEDNV